MPKSDTDIKCDECREPAVPNQTVYGMKLTKCEAHLLSMQATFELDPDYRADLLQRSRNRNR